MRHQKKKVQQKSPVGISLVHGESRWHLHSKISLKLGYIRLALVARKRHLHVPNQETQYDLSDVNLALKQSLRVPLVKHITVLSIGYSVLNDRTGSGETAFGRGSEGNSQF